MADSYPINPFLLFTMELTKSQDLRTGRLFLIAPKEPRITNRYIATSGLPGCQDYASMELRGRGVIPDSHYAEPAGYSVATTPINMAEKIGVEGYFYAISPFEVKLSSGVRGDFGIHRDANVPGTSGCIGLPTEVGWSEFQTDMKFFSNRGIKSLPLLVAYTRQVT